MEEKKDREYFKTLAHHLMFDLSDEEADSIVHEFGTLESQMALLDAVNTEGVEEMIFLREDVVSNVITQDEAMSNVKKKLEGHFVLPKVVK